MRKVEGNRKREDVERERERETERVREKMVG